MLVAEVGFFLGEAKKRGWNVYGSEYGSKLVAICKEKGIEMHDGSIQSFNTSKEFDIVTSFEVIEHINSPIDEMKQIVKLLRTGGKFYCTTPNFNSILRYYLKSKYNVISYPEHLSYYTSRTIHKLFNDHGLKKKWLKTTGISITRFKTSTGKSTEKMISAKSADEVLRNQIEHNRLLQLGKFFINGCLSFFGKGMTIKALYEKKK